MSQRLTKWALALQKFNFEIHYRASKSNGNADALSRLPIVIAEEVNNLSIGNHQAGIEQMQEADPEWAALIRYLKSRVLPDNPSEAKALVASEPVYTLRVGILHRISQRKGGHRTDESLLFVVPRTLRSEILTTCHEHKFAGHFGTTKTFERVRSRYYWPGLYREVEHFVKECIACTCGKNTWKKTKYPLQPIPVEGPFDRVAMDFVGPLKLTEKGNRYLLVVSDYLTKWPEVFATPINQLRPWQGYSSRALSADMVPRASCCRTAEKRFWRQ